MTFWGALAIYLYIGLLFAEVARFGARKLPWVYVLTLFTWAILVPYLILKFRGEDQNAGVHRQP